MNIRTIPRSEGSPDAHGTQSIGRAVGLLRLLASTRNRGATLGDLVEASGLVKPTCRRIMIALIDAGLAEQDPETRRYFLGPEAYVLGTLAQDRFGLHRQAAEHVRRLAETTGDVAFVQMRRDWSVVCLLREDGEYPVRSYVLGAGDRHPLGAGAGGITLLAALDDDEVEAALDANADLLAGRYPVLTPHLLRDLVAEARALGYGINKGLIFPGSWGMGVIVRSPDGKPEACLSIAAIESRMQPGRQPELAALLHQEARRLENTLREFHRPIEVSTIAGATAMAPIARGKTAARR